MTRVAAVLAAVVIAASMVMVAAPVLAACNDPAQGSSWANNCPNSKNGDNRSNMATEAQRVLKGNGFYGGSIDGIIGSITDGAIRNYQASKGLTADGIIGSNTWSKMWSLETQYCSFGVPYDYLRVPGYESCIGSIRHASSSTNIFYVRKLNYSWHASMGLSGPS